MNQPSLQRILRAAMIVALGLMLGVLGLLGVADGVAVSGIGGEWVWHTWDLLPVAALVAGTAGAGLTVWLLRNIPSAAIAVLFVIVAIVFGCASADEDGFTRPLTFEQISPAVPHGNESWELTVREWPQAVQSIASAASSAVYVRAPMTDPDKYAAELLEKREQIEQAWADLAEMREWFTQLNAFEEIGDSTPTRLDAPFMKFSVVRALSQVSAARANALALEGNGDAAADLLLPVIEVSRKFEPGARTFVRAMIARVMLGSAVDALRFVLAHAEVSADRRAALAVALERGVTGPAGARQLMTMEYAMAFDGYYRLGVPLGVKPPGGLEPPLQWLRRPFFLPHATANLHGAHAEQMARLAEKRDLAKLAACERDFFATLSGGQLNNPVGRLVLMLEMPATGKMLESYWTKEDARVAMIAELRKPK